MRYLRLFPYLALFLANLLVGYLGGLRVFDANPLQALQQTSEEGIISSMSLPTVVDEQRSILLITADQLEAPRPQLTGIWLVMYTPSEPRITLLPVYPAPSMNHTVKELARTFRLDDNEGNLVPVSSFFDLIRNQIPRWSGYILLDEAALGELTGLMVSYGNPSSKPVPNPSSKLGSESQEGEDPFLILIKQASRYQDLCWGVAQVGSMNDLTESHYLLALRNRHLSTDLNPVQFLAEFQNLAGEGKSIVCDFPTLSVQARNVE